MNQSLMRLRDVKLTLATDPFLGRGGGPWYRGPASVLHTGTDHSGRQILARTAAESEPRVLFGPHWTRSTALEERRVVELYNAHTPLVPSKTPPARRGSQDNSTTLSFSKLTSSRWLLIRPALIATTTRPAGGMRGSWPGNRNVLPF